MLRALEVVSVSQLFGAIHEMNLMDLCPSSMSESPHGKKKKKKCWSHLKSFGWSPSWGQESVLDVDESSPALKDIPCSGAELGFTVWMVGGEADGSCQSALLGEAELTAGINSGFPPVHMHTCVHTQDNLTTAEETSHVLVATSMVPAAPWSGSSSLLHAPWSARLYPRGSVEMWNCTVKSSGHQDGSQKRGLGLSTGLSNLQPFPAARLPGDVCLAVGNAVAIGQGVMVL